MPRTAPALPPDITVTISGRDRQDIADALRIRSTVIREEYKGRRAKMTFGQIAHERADRIWYLAQMIDS